MLGLAFGSAWSSTASSQDFDPAGRRHHDSAPPASPGPRPGPAPRPTGPRPTKPLPDAKPVAGPSNAALIARYTAIVLAQPGSPFPLQRLAQLYRERDGNLKGLVAEFEKRASEPEPEHGTARVVLAAVYLQDGRIEDATKTYESIIAARPKDPVPRLALGQLARDRNDPTAAKHHYEEALPLVTAQDREQTLRSLIAVSLDLKDFDAAKKFHRELLKQGQGSLLVRGELGRELEARGEFDRAEAEFRDVVLAAAGDNRTLAPALRDLGEFSSRQHKNAEALATLKKALAAAGGEAGVRDEIFALITEVYRADNNLAELIRLIEDEHPNDFQRLASLGALYEETGESTRRSPPTGARSRRRRATSTCASR